MKGPTMRRRIEGSARRTVKPPRSRVRGRITVSTGEAASRSANGSSGIVQLIETSLRTDAGEAAALPLTVPRATSRRVVVGLAVAAYAFWGSTVTLNPVPLRRIALLTLLAFGCATVRVPATAPAEPADSAGVIAPPIVELFIESSDPVPPELAASLDAQARGALATALSAREIPSDAAGATDAVLFVRERAVAVTEARHSQQTWAKVGIVVGIVVVVAAVVALAVSGSKGSSSKAPKTTVPKAAPVAVRPRAIPVPPPPKGLPTVARAVPLPRYYGYRPSPIFVGFYFDFWIPPRPLVLAPETVEEPWYAPEPPLPLATESGGEVAVLPEPPPPEPDPIAAVALQLPPLADAVRFSVHDRGFFAGPQTAIQLDLLDRATGELLWSKVVSAEADPTDPKAMAKLVDRALAGQPWAHRFR